MRLAISNIAWDIEQDDLVAELLINHNINAIDIAPTKYFPDPLKATDIHVSKVKAYWDAKGIEITGMQSLLFGAQGMNLFGSDSSRIEMLTYLDSICRIASGLGAQKLVFGSPKNRDRLDLSDEVVDNISNVFFNELGDIASKHGVIICLEPTPSHYGANFMTTTLDTFNIVRLINHTAIKMQLDIGAIITNKESIDSILNYALSNIGHIHISEPNLGVIGDLGVDHQIYAKAIKSKIDNESVLCIEMLVTQRKLSLMSIDRAIKFVKKIYKDML